MEKAVSENEVEKKPLIPNSFLGYRQIVLHPSFNSSIQVKILVPLSQLSFKSRSITTASYGDKGYRRRCVLFLRFLRRKKVRKRDRRSKKRRKRDVVIILGGIGWIKAAIKVINQKKKKVFPAFLLKGIKSGLIDGIRVKLSKCLGLNRRSTTAIEGDRSVKEFFFGFPLVQEINCICNFFDGREEGGVYVSCDWVLREEKEEIMKRRVWARVYDCVEVGLTRKWPSFVKSLHLAWKQGN